MKIKKAMFSLLICATVGFFQQVSAQVDQSVKNVRGTVLDSESEYPIIGAKVVWKGNEENLIGGITDADGHFLLRDVPIGRQSFEVTFMGYSPVSLSNILVTAGKEVNLTVKLEELVTTLNAVEVISSSDGEPLNEMVTVSANKLKVEEIQKYAGTNGDVSRMAQNYAGVSGASDNRNDIIVRGNSPSSVLWRVEGLDIPSPNHWSTLGTSGGPVSLLNTNNLSNSDFLASAFPAEYGNSIGAVFDLKLRNGNSKKFEFLGQSGFNGFEAGIEGPLKKIGKNASFLVNYRNSTLAVISALGIDFGTGFAIPQYEDLTFKINIPTEKVGRFSVWGIGGLSRIEFLAQKDGNNLFSSGQENLVSGTNTGMIGFNHLYFFSSKTFSKLSFLLSRTNNKTLREENLDTMNLDVFKPTFQSHNNQNKSIINWTINHKFNARHTVKIGVNYDFYRFDVIDSVLLESIDFWFNEVSFVGETNLVRGFGQWKFKISDKLVLNCGLNAMLFGLNDAFSVEPRIGLSYQVLKNGRIGLAYGKHSQLQPIPIYFNQDINATDLENAKNRNLDFMKSDHFVLSYNQELKGGWSLRTELYYQNLYSIAGDPNNKDFSILNFGADFGFPNTVGLENIGEGENYGVEITVNRSLKKGFYALLTTSLFNSTFIGENGLKRNTYYNSNYVLNSLVGKEFKLNTKFTFTIDTRFTYAGGRRYTPINLEKSIEEGREVLEESKVFEDQLADYIRPDLKFGIRYNNGRFTHTFSVDLQNFIGRENEFFKRYSVSQERIITARQRGFFPDVRYQILF